MIREVTINYDSAEEINTEKHNAWEKIIDKYEALSIGHEREKERGTSTLFFEKDLELKILKEELNPIKILFSN